MIKELIFRLAQCLGILMMLALMLSRTGLFRKLITKQHINLKDKIVLTLIFGGLGMLGSYFSVPFNGALVNTRIIGVVSGGLLAGPFVGTGAGLMAGIHRYFIDPGGFTSVACSVSTILEGIGSGLAYYWVRNKNVKSLYGLYAGITGELFRKTMVLLLARPFADAVTLVKFITIPMVTVNSIGLALFIAVIEGIFKEQEKVSAYQAKVTLNIADRTLPYLRKGINRETAQKTAEIICSMTDFAAVALTDRHQILAHVGMGENHHIPGSRPMTELTKRVIAEQRHYIAQTGEEIECGHNGCPLKSAFIVPLREQNKVIGTLKLYRSGENLISNVDVELGLGLAQLFSTQLELSKLEEQSKLLTKAELRILQSQMNPHFLFNTLNTISILCRVNPSAAREVTRELAKYYRQNLRKNNEELIDIYKELEHVKSYLSIEKVRFNNKLNVEYRIDRDLECLIPPLTIQPLVENAVIHGILPKDEGGTIVIRAENHGEKCCIVVEDNGVGMDETTLKKFLNMEFTDSIGVYNVRERLRHIFGEDHRYTITSKRGAGTSVTIVLPRHKAATA